MTETNRANKRQHGGSHYIDYGSIQPWDVVAHFGLNFFEGNALKYILRWRKKGGCGDLEKAIHYLEKQIEIARAAKERGEVCP